jgi:hypothetical protein
MADGETMHQQGEQGKAEPNRIRLPGFITDEDIGLGDVIKRATYLLGIKPCGGCERRAAALNRRFTVTGRVK